MRIRFLLTLLTVIFATIGIYGVLTNGNYAMMLAIATIVLLGVALLYKIWYRRLLALYHAQKQKRIYEETLYQRLNEQRLTDPDYRRYEEPSPSVSKVKRR